MLLQGQLQVNSQKLTEDKVLDSTKRVVLDRLNKCKATIIPADLSYEDDEKLKVSFDDGE